MSPCEFHIGAGKHNLFASWGLSSNKQKRRVLGDTELNFSIFEDTHCLEIWRGKTLIGVTAISFSGAPPDPTPGDAQYFTISLDAAVISKRYRGIGLGSLMAEIAGDTCASIAIQHMMINDVFDCNVTVHADFTDKRGEYFYDTVVSRIKTNMKTILKAFDRKFSITRDAGF